MRDDSAHDRIQTMEKRLLRLEAEASSRVTFCVLDNGNAPAYRGTREECLRYMLSAPLVAGENLTLRCVYRTG